MHISITVATPKATAVFSSNRLALPVVEHDINGITQDILFFLVFLSFKATPATYGGSQPRGQIEAVAAALHHSHSNAGSKLCLHVICSITDCPPSPKEQHGALSELPVQNAFCRDRS